MFYNIFLINIFEWRLTEVMRHNKAGSPFLVIRLCCGSDEIRTRGTVTRTAV